MKTETKLTIGDMIRRTIDDRLHMDAFDGGTKTYKRGNTHVVEFPPPVCIMPGVAMSHGLASVLKQSEQAGCSIWWLLNAIAAWVSAGGKRVAKDGFNSDGVDEKTYADLLGEWPSMLEHQEFQLEPDYDNGGAELSVAGGHSATADETLNPYPIQRFPFTDFPFGGRGKRDWFQVNAVRTIVGRRKVWVLMLPQEY
jgi:hypothetical protein